MNNPNPFVPKGSLMELQDKRRKHMKIGVYCVLTFGVASLMVMLIQGCKKAPDQGSTDTSMPTPTTNDVAGAESTNMPAPDTNLGAVTPPTNVVASLNPNNPPGTPISTSPVAPIPSTPPPIGTPISTPPTAPLTPDVGPGGEYIVVKGDSPARIAKKNGVTTAALMAANPGLKPTKLKVGQKIVIPAGGKSLAEAPATPGAEPATDVSSESYTVKSGDTLTKIAKAHHVKVKALQAANHLTTTKIKVGEKLKIPGSAAAATAPATGESLAAPDTNAAMPPVSPMPTVPQPTAAPAAAPVQH